MATRHDGRMDASSWSGFRVTAVLLLLHRQRAGWSRGMALMFVTVQRPCSRSIATRGEINGLICGSPGASCRTSASGVGILRCLDAEGLRVPREVQSTPSSVSPRTFGPKNSTILFTASMASAKTAADSLKQSLEASSTVTMNLESSIALHALWRF